MNRRLPLKQGSYRPETCTQLVLGYPQHFIFRHRIFFLSEFGWCPKAFGRHFDQDLEVFHPLPCPPPLLRKKSIEIWGRSLGSFLAKNQLNRSYPRPLVAASRIAEGASQGRVWGGAGVPPWETLCLVKKKTIFAYNIVQNKREISSLAYHKTFRTK